MSRKDDDEDDVFSFLSRLDLGRIKNSMKAVADELAPSDYLPKVGEIFRALYRNGDGSWSDCIYECTAVQGAAIAGTLRHPEPRLGTDAKRLFDVHKMFFYPADQLLKAVQ